MASVASVAELREAIVAGVRPEYLFFWGHRAQEAGKPGKWFLSQWWPCRFVVDGAEYATAEQYMMAEKARLFGDEETLGRILATRDPKRAKKLGRQVRGFEEEVWSARRFEIVVRGNMAKFDQDPLLKSFLLSTGETVLVEASPVDRVWGIGLAADHADARNPERWRGLNLLGFALTAVRGKLRASNAAGH